MGEDALYLSFKYNGYLDIPVGAYCDFNDRRYYLLKPENFKKKGSRDYEYDLTMQSDSGRLGLYRFKNTVDGRLKFDMNARPGEFLQMLVDNLNLRNQGWSIGGCIDASEKIISFNHNKLSEVLDTIAKTFDTEWLIEGKVISLGKLERNKDNPLALSYGKGNGFVPNLGRSNYDNTFAFDILYVQGGSRNIDYSTYESKTLLLPKSQTIRYDGTHFEGEQGFILSASRQYITDANGVSIRRADKDLSPLAPEDSYDASEQYPKRVGTVSSWIVVDAEKHFYNFADSSIPQACDYNDYLIEGETMTVIFQSGMLAGREFEISKYDHATRTFEMVPAEIDGFVMPDSTFKAAIGNEYAIFGCSLPDAYICDNATKTGASWDMLKQSVRYMYENEDPRFTFDGVLDGRWAAESWASISARLVLCGMIEFSDTQFLLTPELIRIIGIKQYINKPKYPELTLSNVTVQSSISAELNEYKAEPVLREKSQAESVMFTKRRWRDLKETQEMLEDALEHFTGSIMPISVQTMQLIAGDESLQFRFVTSRSNPSVDANFAVSFNASTKILTVSGGLTAGAMLLQHMTIGINTLSSEHQLSEYHFWDIPKYVSSALNNADKAYYVYARVNRTGQYGEIILSETAIKMEQVANVYHLLIGILNSEYEGSRSFAPMYGYTEVVPGRITTDRIVSSSGLNFFDLLSGEFCMKLPNNSQYITFDATNGVQIKGKVTFGAGSSGLENVEGYTARQTAIDEAIANEVAAREAFAEATEAAIQNLQDQIDDSITTWYHEGDPTMSNYPVNTWPVADYQKHIGDLYYNKTSGAAFRFLLDGTTYKWVRITDEGIAEALAAAARAQDTADGKRTIFFTEQTPSGTHSIGDMWSNGEVLKVWNGTEWVKADDYASQVALEGLQSSFETAMDRVDSEMAEMQDAINMMNDDTVFDASEKTQIRTLWENINGEPSLTDIGAGTYLQTLQLAIDAGALFGTKEEVTFNGVTMLYNGERLLFTSIGVAALTSAFYSLRDYLTEMCLYLSVNTPGFDREHLASLFTLYYKAQQGLIDFSQKTFTANLVTSTMQEFIEGQYATDLAVVYTQIDKKAETFRQNSDPSTDWTAEEKAGHVGDLWMNTTPDANGNTHTYVYRLSGGTYGWEEMNGVPEDVFDEFDGKASIYVVKPSSYKENDMWILEAAYTLSGVNLPAGTIVVATQDSSTWDAGHWVKKDRYTDDSALTSFINDTYTPFKNAIQAQVDGKAETYICSSDPSASWTTAAIKKEHVGDMWLNTSKGTVSGIGSKKTAIYTQDGSSYSWVQQNIPNELFDVYDGKASVYVTKPSSYAARDLWILEQAYVLSGTAYRAGTIVIATQGSSSFSASHWIKRDAYVDETDFQAVVDALDGVRDDYNNVKAALDEINDDNILDATEKGYIRTSWEAINGLPEIDRIGENGSYMQTLRLIDNIGVIAQRIPMTYHNNHLVFGSAGEIDFFYTGIADLNAAFYNLRSYLRDVNLYGNVPTTAFNRQTMSSMFTTYYNAVQSALDFAEKYYSAKVADEKASQYADSTKDALAQKLGYADYAAMVAAALNGKTIIDGGFLRTGLIDVDAIVSQTALIEKLWTSQAFIQRLEAVEATVQRLTVGKLDTLPADTKSKIMAEGNQIVMLDAGGTKKFRVFDGYIGVYDDLRLTKDLNYLSSPLQLTRTIGSYVSQANEPKYIPDELVGFLNMGWCDKGSTLQINSIRIQLTVPNDTNGRSINYYSNAPSYRVALYNSDGISVQSWTCSPSSPTYGSSGTTITATLNLNTTITIATDSNYTLRVYTYRNQGPVVQTSPVYWTSSYGSANVNLSYNTSFYIKLTRSNYEYTHIGRDGLMQVFGDGYIFSDGTDFVVRRGVFMLRLKSGSGIQKSTNGGQTWTSL